MKLRHMLSSALAFVARTFFYKEPVVDETSSGRTLVLLVIVSLLCEQAYSVSNIQSLNALGSHPSCVHEVTAEDTAQIAEPSEPIFQLAALTMAQRSVFVEKQRSKARETLAAAYHNKKASQKAKDIYLRLWRRLGDVVINYPEPGQNFQLCKAKLSTSIGVVVNGAAAFAYQNMIYLCDSELRREYTLVETLVHETAHVIGYENECDAESISTSAMNHGGQAVYGSLSYYQACRLTPSFVIR